MMLRVAERIARRHGAKALVHRRGAGAGGVADAGRTWASSARRRPCRSLRPCLGHDKQETIALAQRIGTYETSIEPYDDCCSLFVPEHPETRAKLEVVEAIEAGLDLKAMADECVAKITEVSCQPIG